MPDVPDSVSAATAYHVQSLWVGARYGTAIAGYKAGLTSPGAQQRFGIDFPVIGVLPTSARLDAGAEIASRPGLMVEVEIGFVVGNSDLPAAMMPVVELPWLHFAEPEHLALADVVAANVSSYRFIAGPTMPLDPRVRDTVVTLTRDGAEINRGTGRDTLGGPLEAYRWMTTRTASLGYRLEPGMVMLTGALGRIVDGAPGRYVARFGSLGEVTFTLR